MSRRFRPVDRSTPYLLPPSLQEWLPEEHLARFIVEIVDRLDLSRIEAAYAGRGSKAYHPSLLLSLLFYGYATGVFSSRKLEAATYDSIAFRFICVNSHPDHDTIATFRRRFLGDLQPLFLQILLIAAEAGLLRLGTVSLDGTKVKANASKHKALSYGYASRLEEQFEAEIEALMRQAEEADREDEEAADLDIPTELKRREDRLALIRAAKEKMERRAGERHQEEQAAYEEKMAARTAREEATGRRRPGRPPKPPVPGPRKKDQINLTDEESRIMPTSSGGFEQAYNAQALVDIATHLIVGGHVTQAPNDKQELTPALDAAGKLPEELGGITRLLADSGYFSKTNVETATEQKIQPLIARGRQAHNPPLAERLQTGRVPRRSAPPDPTASALEQMAYHLDTPEGRAAYAKRKCTNEPVFGTIKSAQGFRQFMLRGHEKVEGEWTLVRIAYNLRRLFRLMGGLFSVQTTLNRAFSFSSGIFRIMGAHLPVFLEMSADELKDWLLIASNVHSRTLRPTGS